MLQEEKQELRNLSKKLLGSDTAWRRFLKGVPAEVIANICNLKMIPGHENVVKQEKSSISLEHLMFEYDRQIHRQVSLTNSSDHQPSES